MVASAVRIGREMLRELNDDAADVVGLGETVTLDAADALSSEVAE